MAHPALAQNFPITPRTALNRRTGGSGGRAAVASWRPTRRTNTRSSAATPCGPFRACSSRRPWRWPELWGMNMDEVAQSAPHLPGPACCTGQDRTGAPGSGSAPTAASPSTVRVSPRMRIEPLADGALPTLKPHLIEPFLTEAIIVDEDDPAAGAAHRGGSDSRVLITRGDRAYARGATPLKQQVAGRNRRLPRVSQCHAAEGPADPRHPRLRGAVPGQGFAGARRNDRGRRTARRRAWCRPPSTSSRPRKRCASATGCCPSRRASSRATCRMRPPAP